jgi:hypothetical protein
MIMIAPETSSGLVLLPKLFGGERRIRTFEALATDLQSVPFGRSGISPEISLIKYVLDTSNHKNQKIEPLAGIEPATY